MINNIDYQGKWPVHANRFVCLIDIMGFKNKVERMDPMVLLSKMNDVVSRLKSLEIKISTEQNSDENPDSVIRSATYSDSIMMYSIDDSLMSQISIIGSISVISRELHRTGFAHRGCLTSGMMTLDFNNAIFFGKPLTEAHLTQEILHFYGVIVHESAEKHLNLLTNKYPPFLSNIKIYRCPFKGGGSAFYSTVMPELYELDKLDTSWLEESIEFYKSDASGLTRIYADNTKDYFFEITAHASSLHTRRQAYFDKIGLTFNKDN